VCCLQVCHTDEVSRHHHDLAGCCCLNQRLRVKVTCVCGGGGGMWCAGECVLGRGGGTESAGVTSHQLCLQQACCWMFLELCHVLGDRRGQFQEDSKTDSLMLSTAA
jgi:hypothetical protein